MAITEGRHGKIQVRLCAAAAKGSTCRHTVGEMGSWSISGWTRDMVEHSAFQDTAKRWKPGLLDAGQVQFNGYWDPSSTEQSKLVTLFTSGTYIGNTTTTGVASQLRFFASDDTTVANNYGFWSCTGGNGRFYITSFEAGQDKSGLGTLNMTVKVSCGILVWSTVIP